MFLLRNQYFWALMSMFAILWRWLIISKIRYNFEKLSTFIQNFLAVSFSSFDWTSTCAPTSQTPHILGTSRDTGSLNATLLIADTRIRDRTRIWIIEVRSRRAEPRAKRCVSFPRSIPRELAWNTEKALGDRIKHSVFDPRAVLWILIHAAPEEARG